MAGGSIHARVPRPNSKPARKRQVLTEVLVETAGLTNVPAHIDRMFKEKSDDASLEILSLDHMKSCFIKWRGGKAEFQSNIVIAPPESAEPEKENTIRTFFAKRRISATKNVVQEYSVNGSSPAAMRELTYSLGHNPERVAKLITVYLKTVVGIHPSDGLSFQSMSSNSAPKIKL